MYIYIYIYSDQGHEDATMNCQKNQLQTTILTLQLQITILDLKKRRESEDDGYIFMISYHRDTRKVCPLHTTLHLFWKSIMMRRGSLRESSHVSDPEPSCTFIFSTNYISNEAPKV